jgi:hypothetical protein
VLAPLNVVRDREGAVHDPKTNNVKTPTGFNDAYKTYADVHSPSIQDKTLVRNSKPGPASDL